MNASLGLSGQKKRRLVDVWPEGISSLIRDLESIGFSPKLEDFAPSGPLNAKNWALINEPRGSDFPKPDEHSFCFLGRDGKLSDPKAWGLVLLDEDSAQIPEKQKFRALRLKYADAAMDFILRKVATPEWVGAASSTSFVSSIPGVEVEPGVLVGPGCEIGEGTVLETGVRLGARVRIGKNCRIGSQTRISDDCVLGDGCLLSSHVAIGGQGFGFVQYPNRAHRRPRLHVGRVVIGDGVRLGSFVAVDRGVFEDTVIGSFTSIDNIVQVAHNCRLGSQDIICSFVGLSGSTVIGDRSTLAGMVGTKGHVRIGNDTTVAAQSGVSRDIKDGETVKGYPPRPLMEALEIQALVGKLPELWDRIKKLEKLK